jgi:hypothetical protein
MPDPECIHGQLGRKLFRSAFLPNQTIAEVFPGLWNVQLANLIRMDRAWRASKARGIRAYVLNADKE